MATTPPSSLERLIADGMIYFFPSPPVSQGPSLLISTADCLPVVVLGHKGYAHIHAGWRGLALGILHHPRLLDLDPYYAFIGPSIGECCFEVGSDFPAHFPQSAFFSKKEGKLFFSLQKEACNLLRSKIPSIQVEESGLCTFCSGRFHSFRKTKTPLRNANLFVNSDK